MMDAAIGQESRFQLYRLLGEPQRLRVLALASVEELSVGELAELLDEPQPNVSRHITPLRQAGLLLDRHQGTRVFVRLADNVRLDPVVADALREGERLCEQGGSLQRIGQVVATRDHRTRAYFANEARDELELRPVMQLPVYAKALSMVGVERRVALDAGVGDGALLDLLAPTFERVYAVDRSAARLELAKERAARRAAIVICDMWDNHWCASATQRVNELAHKMEPVLETCRASGILIVHAPSETMGFYQDYPQRHAIQLLTPVTPPTSLALTSPALPIDDSDGGCDTPGYKEHQAWTRENPLLSIKPNDVISDNGEEIYSFLEHKGIKNLFVMGVHANMCILNRTFAIKQMTNWGITCVLVRDLTNAMYNPRSRPYVTHAAGTELVIEHIEKYWCPTTLSGDLVKALKR